MKPLEVKIDQSYLVRYRYAISKINKYFPEKDALVFCNEMGYGSWLVSMSGYKVITGDKILDKESELSDHLTLHTGTYKKPNKAKMVGIFFNFLEYKEDPIKELGSLKKDFDLIVVTVMCRTNTETSVKLYTLEKLIEELLKAKFSIREISGQLGVRGAFAVMTEGNKYSKLITVVAE